MPIDYNLGAFKRSRKNANRSKFFKKWLLHQTDLKSHSYLFLPPLSKLVRPHTLLGALSGHGVD